LVDLRSLCLMTSLIRDEKIAAGEGASWVRQLVEMRRGVPNSSRTRE
jgi:hypothetical protein